MEQDRAYSLLKAVAEGRVGPDEALERLKVQPFEDIGYARVDTHRGLRQGAGEVIFGQGKTTEQIVGIMQAMEKNGQDRVLITRIGPQAAEEVGRHFELCYNAAARTAVRGGNREPSGIGDIVVATGGTADLPVAEEAAVTAEFLGNNVVRLYDVGVAGLHRLMANLDIVMNASVIIAAAGMEGALASVIGGLADCPVIAVPTSVGYGANFGGLSALLAMLNSCASGVSVVNIDNGFGAGYQASMINHLDRKERQ
ncbi:MAG: nickel pincer cofactor biosynthesis protein LarB [Ruminococcus sp.]|nr:nickel pincer cofactor biosynthesis protein LarB [Ruminococcus sp.]